MSTQDLLRDIEAASKLLSRIQEEVKKTTEKIEDNALLKSVHLLPHTSSGAITPISHIDTEVNNIKFCYPHTNYIYIDKIHMCQLNDE